MYRLRRRYVFWLRCCDGLRCWCWLGCCDGLGLGWCLLLLLLETFHFVYDIHEAHLLTDIIDAT